MIPLPNLKCPEREQAIIDAVKRGNHTQLFWSVIRTKIPNHTATFIVMSDALMMDVSTVDRAGKKREAKHVRVGMTAETEQAIADVLDCSLLTALLADKIYDRADITCEPVPLTGRKGRNINHMMDTSWMIDHNEGIVKQFPKSVEGVKLQNLPSENERAAFEGKLDGMMFGALVSTVGKHWIIEETLVQKYVGCACNYGWHFPGGDFDGIRGEQRVTSAGRLIQGRGYRHNNKHPDYSQTGQLVWNWCLVDSTLQDFRGVIQDTELAGLANHSGAMTYVRQL